MSQYKEYGYKNDGPDCSHSYLLPSVTSMLIKSRAQSVLDVGCGNGFFARSLLVKGINVYGIDASWEGVEIAKRSEPERFFVHDVSSQHLPIGLTNKRFDTLISTEVIEHLYDPRGFVQFCKSILIEGNDGGTLIISTPYHGYLKNLAIALTGRFDEHYTALWDGGHIKFWSRVTLSVLLEEAGFSIKEFVGVGRIPYLWKSMIIRAVI